MAMRLLITNPNVPPAAVRAANPSGRSIRALPERPGARHKVLVIDDDVELVSLMREALAEAGHQVEVAFGGLEGFQRLFKWRPDLVILDVMMPKMDGWEACHRIREVCDVPILMLTARDGETNELRALRDGVDLFMSKPFSLSVLLARVEALLRRSALAGPSETRQEEVVAGDLVIDLARYEVKASGRPIDLSPTEFRLLSVLASRPGQVIPHRELLSRVWGSEYSDEDLYLKLYIRYLRQKLEPDPSNPIYIITKRGIGYFLADGEWPAPCIA